MADYTISYFNFPGGRGEDCRLALYLADASFEDDRVDYSAWAERRADTPFQGLPLLHVDGRDEALAQSNAILVFLGREHDMHPDDPWVAAQHESVMQSCEDLRDRVARSGSGSDDEKRAAREELRDGWMKHWAGEVDRRVTGPLFEGDQIHVVDLKLFNLMNWFMRGGVDHIPTDYFDAFGALMELHGTVANHPKIQAWYADS